MNYADLNITSLLSGGYVFWSPVDWGLSIAFKEIVRLSAGVELPEIYIPNLIFTYMPAVTIINAMIVAGMASLNHLPQLIFILFFCIML